MYSIQSRFLFTQRKKGKSCNPAKPAKEMRETAPKLGGILPNALRRSRGRFFCLCFTFLFLFLFLCVCCSSSRRRETSSSWCLSVSGDSFLKRVRSHGISSFNADTFCSTYPADVRKHGRQEVFACLNVVSSHAGFSLSSLLP